jgi:hypothetical protein
VKTKASILAGAEHGHDKGNVKGTHKGNDKAAKTASTRTKMKTARRNDQDGWIDGARCLSLWSERGGKYSGQLAE